MAVRKVGARVEIDGEREYKQALSELNSGNRVLASEMRKLQAEFKNNSDSTEFLTRKGELLERELMQQRDKVETLRAALANAAQQYGEADSRTQAWAVKLNDAESAQYDLEHAIEENNEALKSNSSAIQSEETELISMGDAVDSLTGKLGIHLPEGAKKALDGFQGLSSGTVLTMSAAAAGVALLYEEVEALHELTKEAAAQADEILTEAMTTGLSTRTIQELKYAENLLDVSYSTITGSLTRLTRNMASARSGNEAMIASFRKLGVSIEDVTTGELRDAESVFYDVIDALGRIENQTDRDATAMELLGKSAQDLNPLILQGSQALKDYAAEAEATDESQLKKLGEVDDAYQRLQTQIDATKNELAQEFAPASVASMETFSDVVSKGGEALVNSGIIKGLGEILEQLTGLLDPLLSILGIIPDYTTQLQPLYTILHAVAGTIAWIKDALSAGVGLLTLNPTKVNTALGLNAKYGMYSNLQQWDGTAARYDQARVGNWAIGDDGNYAAQYNPYSEVSPSQSSWTWVPGSDEPIYNPGRNASGNQNWRGGLTYLSENGAETAILPKGTRIMNAQDTRELGGDTYYITIEAKNVKEFNDIVRIAKNARVTRRKK